MKICSLCGFILADEASFCPNCGEVADDIIYSDSDIQTWNTGLLNILEPTWKRILRIIITILGCFFAGIIVLISIVLCVQKKQDNFKMIQQPIETAENVSDDYFSKPESGEIYIDRFADKGSEGIFTNELDCDVIVSCFYPKTGETVLEFYLRQGDTITMDMPYASLVIYAKDTNGNELFAVTDKTAFTLGESIPIIFSKN